jgi:hypothetical protein
MNMDPDNTMTPHLKPITNTSGHMDFIVLALSFLHGSALKNPGVAITPVIGHTAYTQIRRCFL